MGSEIGNKALLRQLGNYLKIVEPKQAPDSLNTNEVMVTTDIVSFEDSVVVAGIYATALGMGGAASGGVVLIGTGAISGVANLWSKIITDFEDREFRVIQFLTEVSYDAAGAAADALAEIILTIAINIVDKDGVTYPMVYDDIGAVDTSNTVPNTWNYPQGIRADEVGGTFDWIQQGPGWNGRIPYGYRLFVQVGRRKRNGGAAGNFPANTNLNGRTIIHKRQEGLKNSLIW